MRTGWSLMTGHFRRSKSPTGRKSSTNSSEFLSHFLLLSCNFPTSLFLPFSPSVIFPPLPSLPCSPITPLPACHTTRHSHKPVLQPTNGRLIRTNIDFDHNKVGQTLNTASIDHLVSILFHFIRPGTNPIWIVQDVDCDVSVPTAVKFEATSLWSQHWLDWIGLVTSGLILIHCSTIKNIPCGDCSSQI